MRTILETMTNHLGEFHDIDDVKAGTLHNLKAIDVYNMLREYGEEIVNECMQSAIVKYNDPVFPGRERQVVYNTQIHKESILKVKDLL